jgi:lipopolysaccharide/colanic/teichoic acid biosynthesis glycosyltransferase
MADAITVMAGYRLGAPRRAGLRLARVRRARLQSRLWCQESGNRVRRALDIVASALGLLVISPLLVLVAIAMKLTSPGPLLFQQERIGQHGRAFAMHKLRTMHINAEAMKASLSADGGEDIRFKMRNDPRITPVGRILRKFSIDELPQLWNVLMGQMTLVGPRPPVRAEVERYGAYALRRLELRPGLTCLWQVGGRSDLPFDKQVDLDIEYIDRTSAVDNLVLLARTIPAVITGRGSY